jgi:hypothetical protein
MPYNRFDKSKELLNDLPATFSLGFLQNNITINIGGDGRTIQAYIQLMLKTHLIKDIGNFKFKNETKKN